MTSHLDVHVWVNVYLNLSINNPPALQGMIVYKVEYHEDYWPCLFSVASFSIYSNELESHFLECECSCGQWLFCKKKNFKIFFWNKNIHFTLEGVPQTNEYQSSCPLFCFASDRKIVQTNIFWTSFSPHIIKSWQLPNNGGPKFHTNAKREKNS